jgi:hypothetical protein
VGLFILGDTYTLALPIAEDIIKRAEAGEEVSANERRHAIAFMMAMQPENAGTTDLAALFKVSDRQIRLDKQEVREERSKLISEEDMECCHSITPATIGFVSG